MRTRIEADGARRTGRVPADRETRGVDPVVLRSAFVSLFAQMSLGLFTLLGFAFGVPKRFRDDLYPIFALEVSSQAIEFVWYLVVVCKYREIVTWTRYMDWVLSTPVMLLSTSLFLLHRASAPYAPFLASGRLWMLLSFNWLMLAFGLGVEADAIPKVLGLLLGSAMLVATFWVMAMLMEGVADVMSVAILSTMFVVWALYGVAAALPYRPKNVAYNALDVVSKNFYGVFLTVYSLSV